MLDTTSLDSAVERLAGKLRAAPQSALRRGAAAEGLELARELARRAQRIEFPDREPAELPDEGVFVVGDQLAVAGHDLAAALRASGGEAGDAGPELGAAVALVEAAGARSGL